MKEGIDVVSDKRSVGKGTLYWGDVSWREALRQAGIRPDNGYCKQNTPLIKVYFAHRRLADADVYFVGIIAVSDHLKMRWFCVPLYRMLHWDPNCKRYRLQASFGKVATIHVNITLLPG